MNELRIFFECLLILCVLPNLHLSFQIAIDSEKRAFSFGFGGYGRLGKSVVELTI